MEKRKEFSVSQVLLLSLMGGVVSMASIWLAKPLPNPANWQLVGEAAVVLCLIGSARAERLFRVIALLAGLSYWYYQFGMDNPSPAPAFSAGAVAFGAAAGVWRSDSFKFRWTVSGSWWRILIFLCSYGVGRMIAADYPYATASNSGALAALGFACFFLLHVPLTALGWKRAVPGSFPARIAGISGTLIMLVYYQSCGAEYLPAVVFNATLLVDSLLNLCVDFVKRPVDFRKIDRRWVGHAVILIMSLMAMVIWHLARVIVGVPTLPPFVAGLFYACSAGAAVALLGYKHFSAKGLQNSPRGVRVVMLIGFVYGVSCIHAYNPIAVMSAFMTVFGALYALMFPGEGGVTEEPTPRRSLWWWLDGLLPLAIGSVGMLVYPYQSIGESLWIWGLMFVLVAIQQGVLTAQLRGEMKANSRAFMIVMLITAIMGLIQNLPYDSWGSVLYQSSLAGSMVMNLLRYYRKT